MRTLLESIWGLSSILVLLAFSFMIFAIIGVNIWKGAIHQRCYVSQAPEWQLLESHTFLCSETSPCPEGSTCGSSNSWDDISIKELNYGYINFDNFGYASLTVFQISSLNGWIETMKVFEHGNVRYYAWIFTFTCAIVCTFFILNLAVGQIIIAYDKILKKENQERALELELKEMAARIFVGKQKAIGEFVIQQENIEISDSAQIFLREKSWWEIIVQSQRI